MGEFSYKFRKYNGGPIVSLQSEKSKKLRALRGTSNSPKLTGVRVIMRDGVILQPKHLKKILNQDSFRHQPAESLVTAQGTNRAGVPAKTNPGAILRDPAAGEQKNR